MKDLFRIKICGITSLDDAQLVVDAGADALGLVYATSSRQIVDDTGARVVERLADVISCVGVFRHQSDAQILDIVDRDHLDVAQLHDPASTSLMRELRERGVSIVRALHGDERLTPEEKQNVVGVLLDGERPGSGVEREYSLVAPGEQVAFLLAGGLSPENVADAVAAASPWGVDVSSGVEARPGVKDPVKVANFVSRAREALEQKGGR